MNDNCLGCVQRQNVRRRWMIARVLIVDEVSMMSPQVVEVSDTLACPSA